MAAIAAPDRHLEPNPTNSFGTHLSSKNPFRRAPSPSPQNTHIPSPPLQERRASMNPFLDPQLASSPTKDNQVSNGLTEDIFKDLSLLDKPASNGAPLAKNGPAPRAGIFPTPSGFRPGGPNEQRDRPPRPSRGPDSPSKRDPPKQMRPRGMSESSVMDEKERRDRRERERMDRPERTESEERRRRERRREREERHKREKEKIRKGERPTKRPQGLDIIDKLDVTGIYGTGLFHHDGPFDACNPHRNARTARRPAPMQAFPADSANMALGGNGPLRSRIDLDKFHGRGEEGFADYAVTRKADTTILNPTDRTEPVHGPESHGLGTSTFLDGAPASRSALQRRESEDQQMQAEAGAGGMGGGLTRKKSLAQRFRGMSNSRRTGPNGDLRSPDAKYAAQPMDSSPPQFQSGRAATAGGPARAIYTKENEVNPFDNEYDSAFDKKGAEIRVSEQEKPLIGRPGSPKMGGLTRSMTADSAAIRGSSNEEERSSGGGGFLSRMKSLKGGRRARPERRDT